MVEVDNTQQVDRREKTDFSGEIITEIDFAQQKNYIVLRHIMNHYESTSIITESMHSFIDPFRIN